MDQRPFTPAAIAPETAEFNQALIEQLDSYPHLWKSQPGEARAARERGESAFGPLVILDAAEDMVIPAGDRTIGLRVFRADRPKGVYLHIHGGGWVLGATHHQDQRLKELSDRCQVTVVSVDYRLAPEHPYPAGPDDCETAARWLREQAWDQFGSNRLIIGGESAGAHLSAVTLLRLRDDGQDTGFLGANLVYGWYDLRLTPSARLYGHRNLVLNTPSLEWFTDHFVTMSRRDEPDVSPLLADLAHLPPALFTVGTDDPLLDDTLFMYQRWLAAGNRAGLAIFAGGAHAFDAFPIAIGRSALEGMYRFVDGLLG